MGGIDLSDPLGFALLAVGILLALRLGKTVLKLVMAVVAAAGLYLWLGVDGLGRFHPFS
ncbi:MAG TPA: hypothetical protein VM307_07125 [Egibacteraceae bacterium]|nr:hypothetical protein [Egibacteraceae bacterium]